MRASTALLLLWGVCVTTFGVTRGDVTKSSASVVVQALNPTGLRISVPDSPGTDVVIINANVNIPIVQRETGQVSGSVLEARNGFWTLEAKDITLKPGDVVFYWVYTAKGENGQRREGHQAIHELQEPSCRPSATTYNNGRTACAGQLLLDENFNTLNLSLWRHKIQFSDDPDLDFATYVDNPENSFVRDGKLHIKATVLEEEELIVPTKLEKCTWTRNGKEWCERNPRGWNILPPTRSAMLSTRDNFSFKFGRIEIRAKTAAGDWLLSRLILEPQTDAYGSEPYESGRIEMLRSRGNPEAFEPSGWKLGALLNDPQVDVKTCSRTLYFSKNCPFHPGKRYSDEMHVFAVDWTPKGISITVDGECQHFVAPPPGGFINEDYFRNYCYSPWETGTFMAPFDKEFYIQISLMPGGFNTYKNGVTSRGKLIPWSDNDPQANFKFWKSSDFWLPTWTSYMEVDYVRVWAL